MSPTDETTRQDPVGDVDWVAAAERLAVPRGLFVDGEVCTAASGDERPVVSPRDGATLGPVAWAGAADADRAVAAARRAFEGRGWSREHPRERGRVLQRWADLVEAHRSELALLVSLEMGKPIRACFEVELAALVNCLRFYGELADKCLGEITASGPGELALITREPAGVVAAVTPWNFPLTIGGWKLAPALAVGCTVVLKTAEQSPLSMQRVAQLGMEAGLPPGAFNVLNGDGEVVGRMLGEHQDVDVLTFTGSTHVGRHFLRYAADSNVKRVHLELGGKSPHIVLPDAPDLSAAADAAAWAIWFNTGQMCTAGSRLVVHADVADQVVQRVVAQAAEWQPNDPLRPSTRMGPVVDDRSLHRILVRLSEGVAAGARLAVGGRQVRADSGGTYLEPTIVVDAAPDNVLVRDELFGPVLVVQVVRDEAEALRVAADTQYGLAAAVWTADLGTAHRVGRELRAGTVWVNCYEEGDMNVPFGGVKLSGSGRDKSRHALEEYTDLKTTWIRHG